MSTVEQITKLQAAERQLQVAIRLFFERDDLVAVLTLTHAAGQVLRDIGRSRGIPSLIRDSDYIVPERRKEFIDALNSAPNFLKHADKDPEGTLDFRPARIPYDLLESVILYAQIARRWSPETLTFFAWFALKYPNILKPETLAKLAGATVPSGIDVDDFSTPREMIRRLRKKEEAESAQSTGQPTVLRP